MTEPTIRTRFMEALAEYTDARIESAADDQEWAQSCRRYRAGEALETVLKEILP